MINGWISTKTVVDQYSSILMYVCGHVMPRKILKLKKAFNWLYIEETVHNKFTANYHVLSARFIARLQTKNERSKKSLFHFNLFQSESNKCEFARYRCFYLLIVSLLLSTTIKTVKLMYNFDKQQNRTFYVHFRPKGPFFFSFHDINY